MPFLDTVVYINGRGRGGRGGDQLKTTKRSIRDFMIIELKGIKKRFKALKIYLAY